MPTTEKISAFIEQEYQRVAFTPTFDYQPNLSFKLTNFNSKGSDSFSVDTVNEAETIFQNYISTAVNGEIFSNVIYNDNQELFLRVRVNLPA